MYEYDILYLYNIEILRALRFKSSYVFLKRPPFQLDELRKFIYMPPRMETLASTFASYVKFVVIITPLFHIWK